MRHYKAYNKYVNKALRRQQHMPNNFAWKETIQLQITIMTWCMIYVLIRKAIQSAVTKYEAKKFKQECSY